MLRISVSSTSEVATITLEGKLLSDWLADFGEAVCRARQSAPRVQMDLSNVTFIDLPGEQMLQAVLREGVELAACSNFVGELLQVAKR